MKVKTTPCVRHVARNMLAWTMCQPRCCLPHQYARCKPSVCTDMPPTGQTHGYHVAELLVVSKNHTMAPLQHVPEYVRVDCKRSLSNAEYFCCAVLQIKSNQIYLLRVLTVLNQYNHELIVNVAAEEFNPRFEHSNIDAQMLIIWSKLSGIEWDTIIND